MSISPDLRTRNDTINALIDRLDLHGPGEKGHSDRVAVYSVATGEHLQLDDDSLLNLRYAATLHDVGKLRVDRSLLSKLGNLTEIEFDQLRSHAMKAEQELEKIEWLSPCLPMIRHHHERWDGRGYPSGLTGESIPLGARIIAVAETFDHLTHMFGYRQSMHIEEALDEIDRCSGSQFDPQVVTAFVKVQHLIQPLGDL